MRNGCQFRAISRIFCLSGISVNPYVFWTACHSQRILSSLADEQTLLVVGSGYMNKRISPLHITLAIGVLLAVLLAVGLLTSCSRNAPPPRKTIVQGSRLTLELTPGPDYRTSLRFLIFKIPILPQAACWLETEDGRFVQTVFITARGAKKNWYSAPSKGRPEALPVWDHLQKSSSAGVDAVSGATSSGETERDAAASGLQPGRYAAFLEVNRSYDYNERYTRANAGVNGQPSLVYRCDIVIGNGVSTGKFEPVGTGSLDGSDGKITAGLDGLTTALTLLSKAEITYRPE
jgi:hypothetical protein